MRISWGGPIGPRCPVFFVTPVPPNDLDRIWGMSATNITTWISVLASFHPVSAGYVLSALVNALIKVKIPQVGE